MIEVALPDLGEGTKEATIKEWYVKPGSTVSEVSVTCSQIEKFDDLVEVYTDKLVAKIPSTCDGIVKEISYEIDEICLVGHSLLKIEVEEGAAAATVDAPKEQDSDTSSSSSSSSSASEDEKATPQSRSGPGK